MSAPRREGLEEGGGSGGGALGKKAKTERMRSFFITKPSAALLIAGILNGDLSAETERPNERAADQSALCFYRR